MAASVNDKLLKVGTPGTATTLSAPGYTSGGVTINVVSTTGWPTDTLVAFAIDTATVVNGVEVRVAGTYTEYVGIVTSATAIASMTLTYGTPQSYAAGALTRVYIPVSSTRENYIVNWGTLEHTQTGAHGAITATGLTVTNAVLTTPRITTSINDSSGNEVIKTPATGSAVNEVTITNAATAVSPSISATGGDSVVSLNLRGKGLGGKVTIGAGATAIYQFDFVASGCVWTGDAYASTRAASMTAGVVVIGGNPVTVAAVTARTFTASKDTYVDILDGGSGVGTVVYTEVTNNAASPALAANSLRIGIIVTGATTIAAAGSVNQGDPASVLPIASSVAYSVTDSLGNLICNRNPNPTVIGYKQILADFTSVTTPAEVDVTGLAVPVIVPVGRRIKITTWAQRVLTSGATNVGVSIFEGGTQYSEGATTVGSNVNNQVLCSAVILPSAGLHTYKATIHQSGAGTMRYGAGAAYPGFISVELV